MADRFPEIDDLDTSPSAPHTKLATASDDLMDSSSDPSSDFLAREAAILGPDAAQFSASQGPTRNPQSAPKRNAAVVEHEEEDEGDLLGGADDDEPSGGQSMAQAMHSGEGERDGLGDDGFESRYPVEDTSNQGVGPGGSITGTDMPIRTNGNYREETEEEPEIIR